MLPLWMRAAAEASRLQASDAEFERVVAMGVGPRDTGSEEQEVRQQRALQGVLECGRQARRVQQGCLPATDGKHR